jgi:hypothetical protein
MANVIYNGNGNTGGSVLVDSNNSPPWGAGMNVEMPSAAARPHQSE